MATRSNPYEWIEAEMLARIIGPKIQETIRRREPSSVAEMIRHMENDYKMVGVTGARMKEWLDKPATKSSSVWCSRFRPAADDLVEPQAACRRPGVFFDPQSATYTKIQRPAPRLTSAAFKEHHDTRS